LPIHERLKSEIYNINQKIKINRRNFATQKSVIHDDTEIMTEAIKSSQLLEQ
jgi:hypothetical protein